jgi:hypothetical protein
MITSEALGSSSRALQVALFCFVFAAVGMTARPNRYSGDAEQMCQAAESIVGRGRLDIEPTRGDVSQGRGGKHYVKYPLLAVLQCVPAVLLRNAALLLRPDDQAFAALALGAVPIALTGLLAVGMFQLALALGVRVPVALSFALLVVFTTPLWVAGRTLYSETLQATLSVWTVLATVRARDARARWAFFSAGLLAGLAVNAKVLLAALAVAMLVDQAHERWDRDRCQSVGLACLGALPGAIAWFGYNELRYGSLFAQGYTTQRDGAIGFGVPLASGLYGLLFSSGKSVFLYSPLLIAAACGVPSMLRERRRELWLIAIPTLATLLAVSKWWAWSGDWGWGPRLLLPVVPLACVPALFSLGRPGVRRVFLLALAAAGFYVQTLAVLVAPSRFLVVTDAAAKVAIGLPQDISAVRDDLLALHFVPELNPIVGQQWLLLRYLQRSPWNEDSYYPWKTLGIRAWRPRYNPTPQGLDLWVVNGGTLAVTLEVAMGLLTFGLGVFLAVRARARAGPGAGGQA